MIANRLAAFWKRELLLIKATSFALVGVVNAAVNYIIFWLGCGLHQPRLVGGLGYSEAAAAASAENAGSSHPTSLPGASAVTGSYVMNSMTTFAAESGRKLTWRAYSPLPRPVCWACWPTP